jgi:hypothetical protein
LSRRQHVASDALLAYRAAIIASDVAGHFIGTMIGVIMIGRALICRLPLATFRSRASGLGTLGRADVRMAKRRLDRPSTAARHRVDGGPAVGSAPGACDRWVRRDVIRLRHDGGHGETGDRVCDARCSDRRRA